MNTMQVCPIRRPLQGDTFAYCIRKECAFYAAYAKSCSVPVIANILADSEICRNIWEQKEEVEER